MLSVVDPNGVTQHTYSYDPIGRVATHKDARGITVTFTYDQRNEILSAAFSNGDPTVSFQYDALGNRLQMADTTGTTSYVYNALSRLMSVTDGGNNVVQYSYDAAGNRTQILYPQGARPVTYAYDAANRLTSMTDWQQQQFSFAYDSANRLTSVTYPSSTGISHWLAYDAANRLTAQLYQQTAART